MSIDRTPAAHTDIEELAVKLDQMVDASRGFGVQLHRVEKAAEQLRHLSNILEAYQSGRIKPNNP